MVLKEKIIFSFPKSDNDSLNDLEKAFTGICPNSIVFLFLTSVGSTANALTI
jgi:hypothetical protein